jgi:hypothetical protein
MKLIKRAFNALFFLVGSPMRFIRCPACARSHVDRGTWAENPHRTHLCEYCGAKWVEDAHFQTVGV